MSTSDTLRTYVIRV